jgi:hypothetical protein
LCDLRPEKHGHAHCHESKKNKKSSIKINLTMNGWKAWYIKTHECNLYVKGNEGTTQSDNKKPW